MVGAFIGAQTYALFCPEGKRKEERRKQVIATEGERKGAGDSAGGTALDDAHQHPHTPTRTHILTHARTHAHTCDMTHRCVVGQAVCGKVQIGQGGYTVFIENTIPPKSAKLKNSDPHLAVQTQIEFMV